MKYRLKTDMGLHKAGELILQHSRGDCPQWAIERGTSLCHTHYFYQEELDALVQQGIIEKVPEPKWTDEDLLNLVEYIFIGSEFHGIKITAKDVIDMWKEYSK